MKARGILTAITLVLALAGISGPPAIAADCPKLNQVKVVNGVKFVCKKSGSKQIWVKQANKAVAQVTSKPTSKPTPSPKPTVKIPAEYSNCSQGGKTMGGEIDGVVCMLVNGELKWVTQKRLNTSDPAPLEPCRVKGQEATWVGETIRCVETELGRTWTIVESFAEALGFEYKLFVYQDTPKPSLSGASANPVATGRMNAAIDFRWGMGSILNSNRSELVMVQFTGCLMTQRDAQVRFRVNADDGHRVILDGVQISNESVDWVDKVGYGSPFMSGGTFRANEARSFEIWYFERYGGAFIELEWDTGSGWTKVPLSAYRCS